jgi:ABC-type nitrate/sulfonate/bicarbonate transport system permease component
MSTSPSDGVIAAPSAPGLRGVPGGHLAPIASIAVGLLIWEIAAGGFSRFILAPPSAVAARFLDPAFAIPLATSLLSSLSHMVVGFALAFGIALPLGMLMGRSSRLNAMVDPVINALYAIPSVAFVPFLVIWLGLFYESRVALVFAMAFPDILVVIVGGARDIRRNLLNVGRSFGASRLQIARLVLLPAMMPFVMTAFRVGIARAINGMITAELFFAAVNLGAIMKQSAQQFDSAGVLAVIVVVCLLGLAAQWLARRIERRFLAWHLRA